MKTYINIVAILALSACSSSKKDPKIKHVGYEQKWDKKKISDNLDYEKANAPSTEQLEKWKEEAENCTILDREQMRRSGAGGCNPVDPRLGFGDGMFCCPK